MKNNFRIGIQRKEGGKEVWLELPIEPEALSEVLEQSGMTSGNIMISHCKGPVLCANSIIFQNENLQEVIYFARRFEALGAVGKQKFRLITDSGCYRTKTVSDLINALYNIDGYIIEPWVNSCELVGAYYIKEYEKNHGIVDVPLSEYADLGKRLMKQYNGVFFEDSYIAQNGKALKKVYNNDSSIK